MQNEPFPLEVQYPSVERAKRPMLLRKRLFGIVVGTLLVGVALVICVVLCLQEIPGLHEAIWPPPIIERGESDEAILAW